MKNKQAIIDAYVRKEWKNHVFSVAIILFYIACMLWVLLPSAGKTSNTHGRIKSFVSAPTDSGNRLYLIVELENGQHVQVYIDDITKYKQGNVVKLQKQEPLFFGRTVYRFQGLADK